MSRLVCLGQASDPLRQLAVKVEVKAEILAVLPDGIYGMFDNFLGVARHLLLPLCHRLRPAKRRAFLIRESSRRRTLHELAS